MTNSDPMENPQKLEESLDDIDVHIDGRKNSSIFALYAKIFRLLLAAQVANFSVLSDELRDEELEKLILPSNEEWRQKVYHWLVQLQREKDAETELKE